MRAVLWHASRERWMFAPGLAIDIMFEDDFQDQLTFVDRITAEDYASASLRQPLPTVDELRALCDEGVRHGWMFGPPG